LYLRLHAVGNGVLFEKIFWLNRGSDFFGVVSIVDCNTWKKKIFVFHGTVLVVRGKNRAPWKTYLPSNGLLVNQHFCLYQTNFLVAR